MLLCIIERSTNIHPKLVGVYEGTDLTFECYSFAPVIWEYAHEKLPRNARVVAHKKKDIKHLLLIHNIQITNTGSYGCKGKGSDGTLFEELAELIVFSRC